VGRLGGDEFLFLIGVDTRIALERICQSILTSLAEPFKNNIVMGASIGVATYPNDAPDSKSLIKLADSAMYQAKKMGKNQYIFASDLFPDK